jgi:hypothetical protein
MNAPREYSEPTDRLTRLCAAMTDALDAHPEMGPTVKAAVFLQDGKKGGLQLHGYDDSTEAMVDLFLHMRAMMRANGKDLQFITIPDTPEGIER